jgi:hypothetical protein
VSLYRKLRGTIETLFQLGLGGPQLKNNAGVVEMRDPTDASFVVTRGANGAGINDYITVMQFSVPPANFTRRITSSNSPYTGAVSDNLFLFENDATNNPSKAQLKLIMFGTPVLGYVVTAVWWTDQAGAPPPVITSSGGISIESIASPGTVLAPGTTTSLNIAFQRASWIYDGIEWVLMPGSQT